MKSLTLLTIFTLLLSSVLSSKLNCSLANAGGTEFYKLGQQLYTCEIKNQAISSEGFTVDSIEDSSVESFKIYFNKDVEFLPENIAEVFPKIVVYRVQDCAIKVVNRENFKGLSELLDIHLWENNVEMIETSAFADNPKLVWLGFKNNNLKYISDGVFNDLANLKTLELQNNLIRFVDPNAFQGLVKLENLNLYNNNIKFLDSKTLETLQNLKDINLASNQLETFDKKFFINNTKLETISLNDNELTSIDSEMFDSILFLKLVNLKNNDCISNNFIRWWFPLMRTQLKANCSVGNLGLAENKVKEHRLELEAEKNKHQKTLNELLQHEKIVNGLNEKLDIYEKKAQNLQQQMELEKNKHKSAINNLEEDNHDLHRNYLLGMAFMIVASVVGGFAYLKWKKSRDILTSYNSAEPTLL